MIKKENKIFRKMFIVTEYAALILISSLKKVKTMDMVLGKFKFPNSFLLYFQ